MMRLLLTLATLCVAAGAAHAEPTSWWQRAGSWLTHYPLHASCKGTWTFQADDCAAVNQAVQDAMNGMSGFDDCGGGEYCGYTVLSATDEEILGTHETPEAHYVDDLTFEFQDNGASGCVVPATSSSETWYAVLDYGTNFCNLHNVFEATGLDYDEDTSDDQCTQYSTADCTVY